MIFGKREKLTEIGTFTSEKCRDCKESYNYKLKMITRYLVVFFINLLPLSSRFEYVCDGCGSVEAADEKSARESLKKEFRRKKISMDLFNFLKIFAFAAVIAAAVILPLTLINNSGPGAEFIKSLVGTDGTYNISDKEGNNFATVSVSGGVKTLIFLDRVSQLVGEPGADGTFYIHHYYQEATDSKGKTILVPSSDDPGILSDRYDVPVRYYYYNSSNDTFGYAYGVEDLSKIQYTENKIVYPFSYYTSGTDKESYTRILYLNDKQRLTATFLPSASGSTADQFASLEVQDYDDSGRVTKDTLYYFDDDTISLASSSGVSPSSTSDDLLNFIKTNNTDPYASIENKYYSDSKVIMSQAFTMPDQTGTMQSVTHDYNVTEKNGYYIQSESESSSGS